MEAVFLIILLAVLVGVVWWRLNAKKSPDARGSAGQTERARSDGEARTDGALSGGSAAASAEAAGTTGIATAAGFGRPAEPAVPTTADEPAESSASMATSMDTPRPERTGSGSSVASSAAAAPTAAAEAGTDIPTSPAGEDRRRQDQAEWETQWSEAGGTSSARPSAAATPPSDVPAAGTPAGDATAAAPPVHHPEYTEPHAPTLPGAESAAVEETDDDATPAPAPAPATGRPAAPSAVAEVTPAPVAGGAGTAIPAGAAAAETQDRTQSSALVETGADHRQEAEPGSPVHPAGPAGHLAAEEPYGAGSASAGADGSGPAGFGVKGDAGAMVYYEEGHPDYEQTRADVWFESAAHAEAAGFRAPRRKRV